MTYAVIFPGQGAAVPGAGLAVGRSPRLAGRSRGRGGHRPPLARLLLDADADRLATTGASQMAVLHVARRLARRGGHAPGAAGGLRRALVGADHRPAGRGSVAPADGYRLAAHRADASQRSADARPGRMAALMGTDPAAAAALCAGAPTPGSPTTTPRSGRGRRHAPGVDALPSGPAPRASARSCRWRSGTPSTPPSRRCGRRARPHPGLDTVPGHRRAGRDQHRRHRCRRPRRLARPARPPPGRARPLAEAARPRRLGATTFVEVGPGRVPAGKRTVPDVTVHNVATPDDVAALAAAFSPAGAHG